MHNFKFSAPENPENQFGFHVATCCGSLAQENAWCSTWREFFTKNRLAPKLENVCDGAQLHELLEKTWKLLECRNTITPSLVHGDLWSGNWAMFENEPAVFDPASSFSDPEFEFGIMSLFGGISREFRQKYFELVDFAPGFENRLLLYELYHLLNHFQHFGGSYKISALRKIAEIMKI
ncbi:unnamed protein product [Caenorhabditis angaria]|uniref:protein-ribulosamine 3-kinase n=1 Tax=Caenorhabditis angaria TaxID=860376 RepID=A0A9P1INW5_9PELO|nr:unnamed protein product [Caenorhabditis angaria]